MQISFAGVKEIADSRGVRVPVWVRGSRSGRYIISRSPKTRKRDSRGWVSSGERRNESRFPPKDESPNICLVIILRRVLCAGRDYEFMVPRARSSELALTACNSSIRISNGEGYGRRECGTFRIHSESVRGIVRGRAPVGIVKFHQPSRSIAIHRDLHNPLLFSCAY